MANRELVIVFVYDTLKCTKEEDDPDDAVLFFHPGWVSEQQRISLCGQLMGTSFFITSTFSQPRILSLQSGKFAIRYFGQYIMAMGTDRNIPEWVLEQRADLMTSLLKLYFKDMDNLAATCVDVRESLKKANPESSSQSVPTSISNEEEAWSNYQSRDRPSTLSEKLSRIFETFLPIVQYTGQIFANVPSVRLPKSAINVYLEGIRILRTCQELKGVLGGTLLYQNKVVASQLSSSLTKQLVITDPYRIRSPGENVRTGFALPVGVQLLKMYVCSKELRNLRKKAKNVHCTFLKAEAASKLVREIPADWMLKRNKAAIFTVVEEDDDSETTLSRAKAVSTMRHCERAPPTVCGKGASLVCSTPVRDVNVIKLLHGKAVSICNNAAPGEKDILAKRVESKGECSLIPDVVRDAVEADKAARQSLSDRFGKATENVPLQQKKKVQFLSREPMSMPRSASLDSVQRNLAMISLRCSSVGVPGERRGNVASPRQGTRRRFCHTITDPCFPLCWTNGSPLSRCLFDQYLTQHYQLLGAPPPSRCLSQITASASASASSKQETPLKAIKKRPSDLAIVPVSNPSQVAGAPTPDGSVSSAPPSTAIAPAPKNAAAPAPTRRPLSLALNTVLERENENSEKASKPLSECRRKRVANEALPSVAPVARPTSLSGGLALTPLMAKLSQWAQDRHGATGIPLPPEQATADHKEAYPQRVETPITPRPPPTLPKKSESKEKTASLAEDDCSESTTEEVVLFVCGMQSMTLLLVVEKMAVSSEELVHSLREITSNTLESLELLLHRSMDNFPATGEAPDLYSYICLDPKWGATHRGGVWAANDLELVGSLHKDFCSARTLTEVCFRAQDSLVYGYQCGGAQVFYQQQVNAGGPGGPGGLPAPADGMGTVPLKARRCLERDHGVILL